VSEFGRPSGSMSSPNLANQYATPPGGATGWTGWVMFAGMMICAGVAVFAGKIWARTIAVIIALVSAVVNVGFLSAYPIWSTLMITIDILVIWALTVHGGELRED
jgi:hypothetical protein